MKTAKDVIAEIKSRDIDIVDLRFTDFPGTWQHTSYPASMIDEDTFKEGLGFDGSSIRGWQAINESDMLIIPDAATAFVDPFCRVPTMVMICDIRDPITGEGYSRDPRHVAQKAVSFLKSTGIADTAFFGPEAEFFIFDDVRFSNDPGHAGYHVDSVEAHWNTGRDEGPNLAHKIRAGEGYFPVPPSDTGQDLRSEMVLNMINSGVDVECHHHEVATACQAEIDMRFQNLVTMADHLLKYKYIVKNTARKNGKTATFLPKPIFGDNGSGMHTHFSLWKGGKPLFAGDGYAGLSETAMFAIGGILKHGRALTALTNPSTNSYKRLVPGFEAPVNLAYSSRNRSASVRIPMYSSSPKSKRIEFRCPDPTCNPYLAFSAMLMAGIDGIQNRVDPGGPLDRDIYDMPPEELKDIPCTPYSLEDALDALHEDHAFLTHGDVFTHDVIETWIAYKRENEVEQLKLRPHPFEFELYYNA